MTHFDNPAFKRTETYIDTVTHTETLPQDGRFKARPALVAYFSHENSGADHIMSIGRNSNALWDVVIETRANDYLTAQLISRDAIDAFKNLLPVSAENAHSMPGHELQPNRHGNGTKAMRRVILTDLDDNALGTVVEISSAALKMTSGEFHEIKAAVEPYVDGVKRAEQLEVNSNTMLKRGADLMRNFIGKASGASLDLANPRDRATLHYAAHLQREAGHTIPLTSDMQQAL